VTSQATVSIDSFLPIINRECPGLMVTTARDEILRACREFCRASLIWKQTLDSVAAIAGIAEYTLDVPANTEPVIILSMRAGDGTDNRIIYPQTEEELDRVKRNWRTDTGSQPQTFVQEEILSFRLVPLPDSTITAGISDIRVALKPTMTATTVCLALHTDYEEEIGRGALAKLQKIPAKPWTNPERARDHETYFEHAISQARIRARKSYSRASNYADSRRRFGAP